MKVVPLASSAEADWEAFLRTRTTALVYASLPYRNLIQRVVGARPHYLVAMDGDRVCGLLPAFVTSHPRLGPVLNSLPYYGSNGGFVTDGRAETAQLLARSFTELERELGCSASTVIGSPFDSDSERSAYEALGATHVDERIGQVTPLPTQPTEEALFALYDETARRNVRKARKSGVTWRVDCSAEALAFLHETHHENITSIGGLAKAREFFDAVSQVLPPEMWRLYIAELNGQRVAGLLVLRYNAVAEYYTPAILEAFRPLQPLALLVHEAMREAAEGGCRWWNWGGTWKSQVGVYRFKKKWGALDMPYRYYTRVNRPELLQCTREELLAAYPHFFVVPFDKLLSSTQP